MYAKDCAAGSGRAKGLILQTYYLPLLSGRSTPVPQAAGKGSANADPYLPEWTSRHHTKRQQHGASGAVCDFQYIKF